LEMRGCKSWFADDCACLIASPATAEAESCTTRTHSRAGVGFPFMSTKDRTTSKFSSHQSLVWPTTSQMSTCLHSDASVDGWANSLTQCQSCRGTSSAWIPSCYRVIR
jgi:hypothetical protein